MTADSTALLDALEAALASDDWTAIGALVCPTPRAVVTEALGDLGEDDDESEQSDAQAFNRIVSLLHEQLMYRRQQKVRGAM